MGVYNQQLVNLSFEILRSDQTAMPAELRQQAYLYLASLLPALPEVPE